MLFGVKSVSVVKIELNIFFGGHEKGSDKLGAGKVSSYAVRR